MASDRTVGRADSYAFCSLLTLEIVSVALARAAIPARASSRSQRNRPNTQPQAVRLRDKSSQSHFSKVPPLSSSKARRTESPQPRSVSRSPARAKPWLQSPEPRQQRTPGQSSPSLHLSPGEALRKSRYLSKIPFERVVDRLVVQIREWGEKEGLERSKLGDIVEGLEFIKRERKDPGGLLLLLADLETQFPPTLVETFDLLRKALARPPSKGPYDFSVAQARTEAQQTLTALSYKRILEVGSCYQPSPELVSVSLVLFRLLARLVPTLTAAPLTWKTFQTAAQQPGPLTVSLKSAFQRIDSGEAESEAIKELKEQVGKISQRSLEMYDKTGTGPLFLHFISSLIKLQEARSNQHRWRQEAPAFLGAEMPSRKKLLTSLYQRVFQPNPSHSQSQQVAELFHKPETNAESVPQSLGTTEDTAVFLQSLSFRKEEEHSLPVTRNTSPDKDKSVISGVLSPSVESILTPATEPKLEEKARGRKVTIRRQSADAKQPLGSEMKVYWALESAFRRFLQLKAASDSLESLTGSRLSTIAEFQQSIASLDEGLSPAELSKRDLLLKSISEEQRYKEEVRQTFMQLQRQQRLSRGKGLNWMQREVRRDKAKLAQGMERLARAKPH